MPNLRIFGSQIHDTSLIMIASATLSSVFFHSIYGEIDRSSANWSLLIGLIISGTYWYTQYKIKK